MGGPRGQRGRILSLGEQRSVRSGVGLARYFSSMLPLALGAVCCLGSACGLGGPTEREIVREAERRRPQCTLASSYVAEGDADHAYVRIDLTCGDSNNRKTEEWLFVRRVAGWEFKNVVQTEGPDGPTRPAVE